MMFEKPHIHTPEKKEPDAVFLKKALEGAHENLDHYKEMPNVRLETDAGGSYHSQDADEVDRKRPNKYRKVAFAMISNYLEMILMNLNDSKTLREELMVIIDEVAYAENTTKDMIDRFDDIAYRIVKEGEDELKKIT